MVCMGLKLGQQEINSTDEYTELWRHLCLINVVKAVMLIAVVIRQCDQKKIAK